MENIDKILEKYFEGETSLQEEELLRNYFRQPEIEDRHRIYAPMFGFFTEERNKEAESHNLNKKKPKRVSLYTWLSIAAGFLLILSIQFFNSEKDMSKSIVYIDGKKITNIQAINTEALNVIENISEIDEEIIDTQIGILDSFIE